MKHAIGSVKPEKSHAMSTVRRQSPQYNLSLSTPKYSRAALIQRLALAISHHLFQQAPDRLYPARQIVEFRELSSGQLPPTLRSPRGMAEAEEQLPDFV